MPSAAGPLLMHARDCFEFSFLFFLPPTGQLSVTVCGSGWSWGHDVRLVRIQSRRMREDKDSSTSAELIPQGREAGLQEL